MNILVHRLLFVRELVILFFTMLLLPGIFDISTGIIIVKHPGIIPGGGSIIGNILCNDASGAYCNIVSDGYIFNYAYIWPNIDIITYFGSIVMIGAYGCKLGQITIVSDNRCGIDNNRSSVTDIQAEPDSGFSGNHYS